MLDVLEPGFKKSTTQPKAKSDVLSSTMKLRAELAQLSDAKLDDVEDELNFYAFTRIQGAHIQNLLDCL